MASAGIKSRIEKLEGAAKSGGILYAVIEIPGEASDYASEIDTAVEQAIPPAELRKANKLYKVIWQGMADRVRVANWFWAKPKFGS